MHVEGMEYMSSEAWWESKQGAHNGKKSSLADGVQRRKAEVESKRKVLKGLSRNEF